MYLTHFGFQKFPFSNGLDAEVCFHSSGHQAALNMLLVALRSGESMIKITGDSGTGKTLLCRKLSESIKDEFTPIFVDAPFPRTAALLGLLASKLGIRAEEINSQHMLSGRIEAQLHDLHAQGTPAVLLVDEAQVLTEKSLDMLRLLTNLNRAESMLLSVVLFATPELDRKLEAASLAAVRQRISFSQVLEPLQPGELKPYVEYRLNAAGDTDACPFAPASLDSLYRASRGVPRLVNTLAHKSLMAAYGSGADQVSACHVRQAVRDTGGALALPRLKTALASSGYATLVTFAGIGMYLTMRLMQ